MSIWNSLWKVPRFANEWQNLIATFLQRIMVLLLLITVLLAFSSPASALTFERIPYNLAIIFWISLALFALRKGYLQTSAVLLISGLWLTLAAGTLTSTGVYSPAYMALIILIIVAGTTVSNQAVVVTVTANLLLGLFAVWQGIGSQMVQVEGINFSPFGMWVFMQFIYIIIAAMVVTVRRTLVNMVERIRRDTTFYQSIVDDQTEYIKRWLPGGVRTFVNTSYCRYFGLTPEEAIGTSFIPLIHDDDLNRFYSKIARLSPTNPIEIDEHRIQRSDGSFAWLQWLDRALYDDRGNLLGYQSVGRDITRLKELEAKDRELAVTQEREAILRDFLSTISHDLQTPLTVVRTNLHIIRKLNEQPKINEKLDRVEVQINRLAQMIGDILTVARLENIPVLTLSPAPLQTILDNTIISLQDEAKAKQITIAVTLDTSTVQIEADTSELQRAFTNLVQNAIKYTPDGGNVRIGTQHNNGSVFVEIADTGIGISAEDLPRIFDRFYRADNAKDFEKGTGLGLAITKRIIELHAGTVVAVSQLGSGTTFKVQLPLIS
jgi:PAS domain S-box-containing protein